MSPKKQKVIVGTVVAAVLIVPSAGIALASVSSAGEVDPAADYEPAERWILSDWQPSREKIQARKLAEQAKYTPAYAKSYAKQIMKKKYGWGDAEFRSLVQLWNLESDWDYQAENPSSGAYGIPQSLPAGKMKSAGKDYLENPEPQIRWGLKYISDTYGSPSAALGFHNGNNWY